MTRAFAVLALVVVAGCASDPAAPTVEEQRVFVTQKRAWRPGERDSVIAAIKANRDLDFPMIGDISDDADRIYADTDSVTELVSDIVFGVAAASPGSLLTLAPQFATNWNITGVDVRVVNKEVTPNDSTHWIGVYWSNPSDNTWKGFILAAANTNPATVTVPQRSVNTTSFDAAGGKSGAGGGEFRASSSTFWQATGVGTAPNNTITISAAAYGAATTVTSGPFLGGTVANGTMQGRMRAINMARISGATTPSTFSVDMDFSGAAINAIRYVCVFRTPCTTNN